MTDIKQQSSLPGYDGYKTTELITWL